MSTNTDYAALYDNDLSGDLDFLEKNVLDYPASSLAHFLLLYHLKKNNDARFDEQAKQAGIYFQNPYWIEFQLSKLKDVTIEKTVPADSTAGQETFAGNTEIETNDENPRSEIEELVPENESEINLPVVEESADEELPAAVNKQITENLPMELESSESANDEFENQSEIIHEEKTEEFPQAVNDGSLELEQFNENLPSTTEVTHDENQEFVDKTNENAIINNETVEVPVVEEAKEDFATNENITEPTTQEENEPVSSSQEEETFNEDESVLEIKVPDEGTSAVDATNKGDEDEAIPFEPLHTVDYFASQGIQLSEEALNNDQLGRQVKSFTAWLKSMKKLHPGQLPEQNEVIEKLIQTSSEVSNQNANVLTEAMAEVLVKQGKREKAIEMYQKLSLINPSKSAYFAAKIESLKIV